MESFRIVPYSPEYQNAFKELNEAWILKYFELEEDDINTLNHPYKIIEDGGFIFVALLKNQPVGVCALRKRSLESYELSKMAVKEKFQGLGIGKSLVESAINIARQTKAKRIYLEGNTLLEASIHLYQKLGFKKIPGMHSVYRRVNIFMEMHLE